MIKHKFFIKNNHCHNCTKNRHHIQKTSPRLAIIKETLFMQKIKEAGHGNNTA